MLDVRRKMFYSDTDTETCTASFYTQRLLAYKKYSSLNTTKNQRHLDERRVYELYNLVRVFRRCYYTSTPPFPHISPNFNSTQLGPGAVRRQYRKPRSLWSFEPSLVEVDVMKKSREVSKKFQMAEKILRSSLERTPKARESDEAAPRSRDVFESPSRKYCSTDESQVRCTWLPSSPSRRMQ